MLSQHTQHTDIHIDPLFSARNHTCENMVSLFDHVPGAIFFVKDLESRFMAANQAMLESKGLHSHEQIIGFSDFDFSPPALARIHVQQDRQVMNHGEAINDRVWFEIGHDNSVRWMISSKQPLQAADGYTYGLVGISYFLEQGYQEVQFFGSLHPVINYIQTHFTKGICLDEMADLAGMPSYDFNIEFLNCLDMPLHQFHHCYRMEVARHLLKTTSFLERDICNHVGFVQLEDFQRHFQRWNGINAEEYRKRFALASTVDAQY